MTIDPAATLRSAEAALMEYAFANETGRRIPVLFILGAPRTGSTVFFQALVEAFCLSYFSNLTNSYLFQVPLLGLAIQAGIGKLPEIDFTSHYGKTTGLLQPSEGSLILRAWFGGGHPSQLVSTNVLPGLSSHLRGTLRAATALLGRPLAIKNAWNCFRVPEFANLLPEALFIWIRRDITAAAKSDLHARYATKGSPTEWNSATPHNVDALRARPYWEQVVENQYEFNAAIERDLNLHAKGRFRDFWYEDFCSDTPAVLKEISTTWPTLGPAKDLGRRVTDIKPPAERWSLPENDSRNVETYARAHEERFRTMRYRDRRDATHGKRSVPIDHAGWHFRRVTPESLQDYLRTDWVADWLGKNSQPDDELLTSQRWLRESPAKRHIFDELYGDLLRSTGLRILDVGGGLSAFTRELVARHQYEVVELLAHEGASLSKQDEFQKCKLHQNDWLAFQPDGRYDVILANDLLPNVDQRLELFLTKFMHCCRELRMSLTYFDEPRFYRTRRIDGDEILFMLAWTWEQLNAVVDRVGKHQLAPQLLEFRHPSASIFPNGRQVVLMSVRNSGDDGAQPVQE